MTRALIRPNLQEVYFDSFGRPTIEGLKLLEAIIDRLEAIQAGDSGTGGGSSITNGVDGLTVDEVAQLARIDTTTVTEAQWAYLGSISEFIGTLLDDASASEARTTLDAQQASPTLDSLSGVSFAEGTWSVRLSDQSGNSSPTTVTGFYQRLGNTVHAGFRALSNIDTTGLTGGDDILLNLPLAFRGYFGGTAVLQNVGVATGGLSVIPFSQSSTGTVFKLASFGDDTAVTPLTVADLTDDTSDIIQCALTYSISAGSVTVDTTGITCDTILVTADAA